MLPLYQHARAERIKTGAHAFASYSRPLRRDKVSQRATYQRRRRTLAPLPGRSTLTTQRAFGSSKGFGDFRHEFSRRKEVVADGLAIPAVDLVRKFQYRLYCDHIRRGCILAKPEGVIFKTCQYIHQRRIPFADQLQLIDAVRLQHLTKDEGTL